MRKALILMTLLFAATAAAHPQPHVVPPGSVEGLPFPGHETFVLAGPDATPSTTTVQELVVPPRSFGAPPHVHAHEDEYFYVLEGAVDFLDRGEVVRAEAGALAVLPRGHLHGFWNDTDAPARLLLVISPGGFTDFFDAVVAEIRRTHPGDPRAVGALVAAEAAKRGVELRMDAVPERARHLLPK